MMAGNSLVKKIACGCALPFALSPPRVVDGLSFSLSQLGKKSRVLTSSKVGRVSVSENKKATIQKLVKKGAKRAAPDGAASMLEVEARSGAKGRRGPRDGGTRANEIADKEQEAAEKEKQQEAEDLARKKQLQEAAEKNPIKETGGGPRDGGKKANEIADKEQEAAEEKVKAWANEIADKAKKAEEKVKASAAKIQQEAEELQKQQAEEKEKQQEAEDLARKKQLQEAAEKNPIETGGQQLALQQQLEDARRQAAELWDKEKASKDLPLMPVKMKHVQPEETTSWCCD